MTSNQAEHYILSLFSRDDKLNAKQLELIGIGRRTPSILYTVERKRLFSLYGMFPHWDEHMWIRIMNAFEKRKWLIVDEDGASLSLEGEREKEQYLKSISFFPCIQSIEYTKTRPSFWDRFLFICQILSEFSYNNKHYFPHLTSAENQRQTKQWINNQRLPMKELTKKWADEFTLFLETLPQGYADLLVDQLMGYEQSGLTKRQLLETYALSETDYTVLMTHLLESFRLFSFKHDVSLIQNLWSAIHLEESNGLNKSAFETLQFIEKGYDMANIARMRRLKENTIIEHLLEIVLVTHWTGYRQFIPDDAYEMIQQCFIDKPHLTYGEFKVTNPDLPFYWFRLIEIERMRARA